MGLLKRLGVGIRRSGLVVCLLWAAAVGLPSTAPTSAAVATCAGVYLAGARGSGEGAGLGGPVDKEATELQSLLAQKRVTLRAEPVSYPAESAVNAILTGSAAYRSSVSSGVEALLAQLRYQALACPAQWFVLAGYSQGAHVVTDVLDRMSSSDDVHDRGVKARIAGVTLFGSPAFTPEDDKVNVEKKGSYAYRNVAGFFGDGSKKSVLSESPWKSLTRSYCLRNDAVCNFRGPLLLGDFTSPNHPHYKYASRYATPAAEFLYATLRKRNLSGKPPKSAGAPVISTTTLPKAVVGAQFSATLQVNDFRAGTWSVVGVPPADLTLSSRGVLSGRPTTAGKFSVTVRFADLAGLIARRTLTLEVRPASPTGGTTLVSISPSGVAGDTHSSTTAPTISGDGAHVAFSSQATNLVVGDTNQSEDVFVRDIGRATTSLVSVDVAGQPANGRSWQPAISRNGRFVAFTSLANDLVAEDTNDVADVFVRDLVGKRTYRVSEGPDGRQADGASSQPSLSSDGQYLAYTSIAGNLVDDDTGNAADIFLSELPSGQPRRISLTDAGPASAATGGAAMSADGRCVAYHSEANGLVPGDANGQRDVFLFDRRDDITRRISESRTGGEGNSASSSPAVSDDCRYVSFYSTSSNLAPEDPTGMGGAFVKDLESGAVQGLTPGFANPTSISGDGRFVAVTSPADLDGLDSNHAIDIFRWNRATGMVDRISWRHDGKQAEDESYFASLSGDGRCAAFASPALRLVDPQLVTERRVHVYVRCAA